MSEVELIIENLKNLKNFVTSISLVVSPSVLKIVFIVL